MLVRDALLISAHGSRTLLPSMPHRYGRWPELHVVAVTAVLGISGVSNSLFILKGASAHRRVSPGYFTTQRISGIIQLNYRCQTVALLPDCEGSLRGWGCPETLRGPSMAGAQ
jgi:hypothetical protein